MIKLPPSIGTALINGTDDDDQDYQKDISTLEGNFVLYNNLELRFEFAFGAIAINQER